MSGDRAVCRGARLEPPVAAAVGAARADDAEGTQLNACDKRQPPTGVVIHRLVDDHFDL